MTDLRPTLFLDFDDVFCLNNPYGGYDVAAPNPPADLWSRLFHEPAVSVLKAIVDQSKPRIVITTSWLRIFDKEGFDLLLDRAGLQWMLEALHEQWEAPPMLGDNRLQAIERWLSKHHSGEPFVVLDDDYSGIGLARSRLDRQGRVVLCMKDVGLKPEHLALALAALSKKYRPPNARKT